MDVPEIDVAELALVRETGATLIDVREPDEYSQAHVPGAILDPSRDRARRARRGPDRGHGLRDLRRGGRSLRAAEFYRTRGIDAVNVAGGTRAWIDAGHPVSVGAEP